MQNKKNKKGFTLIEILVVIAIAGILASIALVNTGKNPDRDVNQEKARFISFLRDVQNKALAAEKVPAATGKVCGFGINFIDSSSAQIFYIETKSAGGKDRLDVDCGEASKKFTDNANSSAKSFPDNSNPEKFYLTKNVTFQSTPRDIIFQIPNGNVYYNDVRISNSQTLTLTKTDGSITSTADVIIKSSGLIQ